MYRLLRSLVIGEGINWIVCSVREMCRKDSIIVYAYINVWIGVSWRWEPVACCSMPETQNYVWRRTLEEKQQALHILTIRQIPCVSKGNELSVMRAARQWVTLQDLMMIQHALKDDSVDPAGYLKEKYTCVRSCSRLEQMYARMICFVWKSLPISLLFSQSSFSFPKSADLTSASSCSFLHNSLCAWMSSSLHASSWSLQPRNSLSFSITRALRRSAQRQNYLYLCATNLAIFCADFSLCAVTAYPKICILLGKLLTGTYGTRISVVQPPRYQQLTFQWFPMCYCRVLQFYGNVQ